MTIMKILDETVRDDFTVKCQIVDTVLDYVITEFYANIYDIEVMVDVEGLSFITLPATFVNNIGTIVSLNNVDRLLNIIQTNIITNDTIYNIQIPYDNIMIL